MKKYLQLNKPSLRSSIKLANGQTITPRTGPCLDLILQLIEKANRQFNRLVKADEIYNIASSTEKKLFEEISDETLSVEITIDILEALKRRNLVFKNSYSFNKFYGSSRIFDPKQTEIPFEFASKPQQVLQIMKDAISFHERAVCYDEIYEFAKKHFSLNLDRRLVMSSIRTLQKTKSVKVAVRRHGNTRGGIYYLPSQYNEVNFPAPEPNTMLDCTKYVFNELWEERAISAEMEDKLPLPLLTNEIQARLEMIFPDIAAGEKPGFMTGALWQLSKTIKSNIRGIKLNGTRQVCWAPDNLPNDQLNIKGVYANDRLKIVEAVERACQRLNQPVTANDVQYEIETYSPLSLNGKSSVSLALSASAEFFKSNLQNSTTETINQIYNLGRINGNSYYYSTNFDQNLARCFFELHKLEDHWKELTKVENLENLKVCRLKFAQAGRILLFLEEAKTIQAKLQNFQNLPGHNFELKSKIKSLYALVSEFIPKFYIFLNELNIKKLPAQIPAVIVYCWTAKEMIDAFIPVYPLAPEIKEETKNLISRVTGILRRSIRRVPSTLYPSAPHSHSPFVYDKTDALIFAGLKWGGNECRIQANYARVELGMLRDINFVLPETTSDDFEVRMAAIACLAFLQTEKGNMVLRHLIMNDEVAEVRMSALWAYAFAKGEDAFEIAQKISVEETNPKLSKFASKIAQSTFEDLWFL